MAADQSALLRAGLPAIPLPEAMLTQDAMLRGRNPFEGYQRSVGLEYGDLSQKIAAHPLYQEAIAAATGRTVMDVYRVQNLFLLMTCFFERLEERNIIEFGSFRGGSLLFMGVVMKRLYPAARIFGLDTFKGMPRTNATVDLHSENDFANTSLEDVQGGLDAQGLTNVTLVQGLVQDSFPARIPPLRFGLAHIDLDIYEPILYVQNAVWPHMTPGGYIVYDDATASSCLGASQAVEELIMERRQHSEQIFPHFVFRATQPVAEVH